VGSSGGLSDNSGPLQRAISGTSADGLSHANLTFAPGFLADYAIGLSLDSGASLYRLNGNGPGSLELVRNLDLAPLGNANAANYRFSMNWSDIDGSDPLLAHQSGGTNTFSFQSIYATANGSHFTESYNTLSPDSATGYGPVTFLDSQPFLSIGFPVPEPSSAWLGIAGGLLLASSFILRRKR
jgi:hypothetical protein